MRKSNTKPGSSSCSARSATARFDRRATSAGASRATRLTARITGSTTREPEGGGRKEGRQIPPFSYLLSSLTGNGKVPTYQVTFVTPDREVRTEVSDTEYLLDAAVAAGLDLPYMCLQGWCTTCAGKLLQGQVDQSEARRLYRQDEAAGFVLLCSAFARSDLRILTHQKEQLRAHRRALGLPAPRG